MATADLTDEAELRLACVDWKHTPVGPREHWPQSLRTALGIMATSRFPMVVMWGPEFVLFYNAAYDAVLREKHPWAFGKPVREVWPEIWPTIGPMLEGVLRSGRATYDGDLPLVIFRNGRLEESYFTFSYSPIVDEAGVGGIFCAVNETTQRVIATRRLRTLYELESHALEAKTISEACARAVETLEQNPIDVPFSRVYLVAPGHDPQLVCSGGARVDPHEEWPIRTVLESGRAALVRSDVGAGQFARTLEPPSGIPDEALILPLAGTTSPQPIGVLVAGVSPHNAIEGEYRSFLELVAGQVASVVGSVRAHHPDVVEAFRAVADLIPQIVWTASADGSVDYVNRSFVEYRGRKGADGAFAWAAFVHPEDLSETIERWAEAVRGGTAFEAECRVASADAAYRWHLARAVPLHDADGTGVRWFGTFTDIEDRKGAERRAAFLARAGKILGASLERQEVLARVVTLCVPELADWCEVVVLAEDGTLQTEALAHRDPAKEKLLGRLRGRRHVARDADGGIAQVLRTGRSAVLAQIDPRLLTTVAPSPEDRAVYDAVGYGSALIVPLIGRDRTLGTLMLVSDEVAHFTDHDRLVAEELGHRAGIAIANSQSFEREHQVATTLQRALLPQALPALPTARLDWAYRPAERNAEVGGDWYDAFLSPSGSLFVSIGDVAGHGFGAALTMGSIRKLLRTLAFEYDDPARVLERAARVVLAEEGETFATALVGRLDPASLRFDYACAGHVPPILVLPEGLANRIGGGGLPLGVVGPNPVEHHSLELTPGAALCLYTDGLVEFDRDMIAAEQRLHHLLAQSIGFGELTATLIVDRMLRDEHQTDDVAVLVVQAKGQPLTRIDTALPSIPRSAATVRGLIRRFAETHGLDADAYFRLLVVAGEAVANAAEHAYDDAEDALRLTAWRVADLVRIVVCDRGRWPARSEEHRGRGLALIETLSEELEIERGPAGTRLRAVVRVNAS